MSIRLERERIWWNINGSINQSNAFLGSNPWPCPNGLHSNPVNHWAWKGGYFWSYGIKIQTHFDFRIQTLGEFLATSVTLLIALLGGADTTLKIYFKNSHESKVFSKVTWIWIWILKSESLESILWSQNTSNNLGLKGAETRVVCEPQDCLKNSISGGNGRDKLCAMCKRSSYLNMQDIFGKSRSKYHFNIYRFNLRNWFIKK